MVSTLQTEKLSAQTNCHLSAQQIYRIKILRLKPRFSDSKFLFLAEKRINMKNLFLVTSEE